MYYSRLSCGSYLWEEDFTSDLLKSFEAYLETLHKSVEEIHKSIKLSQREPRKRSKPTAVNMQLILYNNIHFNKTMY